ncbi:MAG: BREX-3 system P-loop-containing protein BrxF [Desulfosporosinus sp.]
MWPNEIEYTLQQAIKEVNDGIRRHRLIVITSCQNITEEQAKTAGVILLNLNLKLSERLIDIAQSKRSRAISVVINEIIEDYPKDGVLLVDHFEILFLPELEQDPIRLFEDLSRERTLVLLWPGAYKDGVLSYAQPWHSEYREFAKVDALII